MTTKKPNFIQIAQMTDGLTSEMIEEISWANGMAYPKCESIKGAYKLKGSSTCNGLDKCKECRKQFTVTVGTIFDGSRIPLNNWW